MIAVVQRCRRASVSVNDQVLGEIGAGLAVLCSIEVGDGDAQIAFMRDKLLNLRIFPSGDNSKAYDRSVTDVAGGILLISNFTVAADTRSGRRPSLSAAMKPDEANPVFERLLASMRTSGLKIETGKFGAEMLVTIENDGPSTWIVRSDR